MEQDSEPQPNVQYKQQPQSEPHTHSANSTESEDSENATLLSPKHIPQEKKGAQQQQQRSLLPEESTKRSPNESFLSKSRAVALQQTKLLMEKHAQQNRSFLRIEESEKNKIPNSRINNFGLGINLKQPPQRKHIEQQIRFYGNANYYYYCYY